MYNCRLYIVEWYSWKNSDGGKQKSRRNAILTEKQRGPSHIQYYTNKIAIQYICKTIWYNLIILLYLFYLCRSEGSKLNNADEVTRKLWFEEFSVPFPRPGSMYRGNPPQVRRSYRNTSCVEWFSTFFVFLKRWYFCRSGILLEVQFLKNQQFLLPHGVTLVTKF